MPRYDFTTQRLFVRAPLAESVTVPLDRAQANYLLNVLRLKPGDGVLLFNGTDGEWRAVVAEASRKNPTLRVETQARAQTAPSDLHHLFAPLKHARLDYMVEKAVEMGVGRLRPVLTRHGQVTRLNRDRVEANAIEAAEQCGILSIPAIDEPTRLDRILDGWQAGEETRRIIFCDESEEQPDPLATLAALTPSPLAVLIGPEGGFAGDEREHLRALPFVTALPLGPRILRADTAAVAALALVQATLGDWKNQLSSP